MAKILLVDDMKGVRDAVTFILERGGHDVAQAADGLDGLDKLKNRHFDLIISDVLMPKLDGAEFARRLRESGFHTPLLTISAGSSEVDADTVLATAAETANATLKKPFSAPELLAAVEELIAA